MARADQVDPSRRAGLTYSAIIRSLSFLLDSTPANIAGVFCVQQRKQTIMGLQQQRIVFLGGSSGFGLAAAKAALGLIAFTKTPQAGRIMRGKGLEPA